MNGGHPTTSFTRPGRGDHHLRTRLRAGDDERSKDLRDEDDGLIKSDMPRRKATNRLMIGDMANSLRSSC
jgi:hypothetical protein